MNFNVQFRCILLWDSVPAGIVTAVGLTDSEKLDKGRSLAARRGYYEVEGRTPDGQSRTFRVPTDLLTHLQRHGPTPKFYDALLLSFALNDWSHVYRGLKREEYEEGYCFVAQPPKRYRSHDIELPPPPGLVFLVFVRSDGIVMDWEWRKVDENDPTRPKDWHTAFGEEIRP